MAIRFSWDSRLIACGEDGGSVSLFDVHGGMLVERRAIHRLRITSLSFVEDAAGAGLVTSSWDGTLSRFQLHQ
jgi:WD40 repeat protein